MPNYTGDWLEDLKKTIKKGYENNRLDKELTGYQYTLDAKSYVSNGDHRLEPVDIGAIFDLGSSEHFKPNFDGEKIGKEIAHQEAVVILNKISEKALEVHPKTPGEVCKMDIVKAIDQIRKIPQVENGDEYIMVIDNHALDVHKMMRDKAIQHFDIQDHHYRGTIIDDNVRVDVYHITLPTQHKTNHVLIYDKSDIAVFRKGPEISVRDEPKHQLKIDCQCYAKRMNQRAAVKIPLS